MVAPQNETHIIISLTQLAENYKNLQRFCSDHCTISAVLKADAYGFGICNILPALYKAGCRDFWVANFEEAMTAKQALDGHANSADKVNIYILHGLQSKENISLSIKYGFIPVINSTEQLRCIVDAINTSEGKQNQCDAVIQIDTGMNRLGFDYNTFDTTYSTYRHLFDQLNVKILMSHLANAYNTDHPNNELQYDRFNRFKKYFPKAKRSIANSGAIFLHNKYHMDLVRPGVALYGFNTNYLKPIITIKAAIIHKAIVSDKETTVGYNSLYNVHKGSKLVTIEYGYADGYPISDNGKSDRYCWCGGYKLPIAGRINMDTIVLDASQLPDELFSSIDYAEVFNEHTPMNRPGIDGYEIFANITRRYKHIYI